MGRQTSRRAIRRLTLGEPARRDHRSLAVEEPLEIRSGGQVRVVIMRTPGRDVELAAGFLVAEGDLRHPRELRSAKHCAGSGRSQPNTYNVLDVALVPDLVEPAEPVENVAPVVALRPGIPVRPADEGETCGAAAIDVVTTDSRWPVADDDTTVEAAVLAGLTAAVGAHPAVTDRPAGQAVAALVGHEGEVLVVRDDVAARNAVDKVIGWATLQRRLPLPGTVLYVSSSIGFDLVRRAVMAGIPIVASPQGSSSLAVELAATSGVTVVGNLTTSAMDVFTHPDRVSSTVEEPTGA
jgi:FdhD protein